MSAASIQKIDFNRSYELDELNFTDSGANFGGNVNVTVQTPAIRGRIECSPYPSQSVPDTSNWLQVLDLQNTSYRDVTANPRGFASAFELLTDITFSTQDGSQQWFTNTFAHPARLVCCANETDGSPDTASIGYWSANGDSTTQGNFTVKWIVGEAIEQQFMNLQNNSHFLWQKRRSMTAINCQPIIETANASVTLDLTSGAVQGYFLMETPKLSTSAWSNNYEEHNSTEPHIGSYGEGLANYTVR